MGFAKRLGSTIGDVLRNLLDQLTTQGDNGNSMVACGEEGLRHERVVREFL